MKRFLISIVLLFGVQVHSGEKISGSKSVTLGTSISLDTLRIDGKAVLAIITAVNYLRNSGNEALRKIPKRLEYYQIYCEKSNDTNSITFESEKDLNDSAYAIGGSGPNGIDVRLLVSKNGRKVLKQILFK